MNPAVTAYEKRNAIRSRTLLAGSIAIAGQYTLDCVVRNLNAIGARVELDCGAVLPDDFILNIPHRSLSRPARVVWRSEKAAGLMFDETTVR